MAKLERPFDLLAFDVMQRAPMDTDKAKEALLRAAGYIREGRPLPMELAEWIAGAFEVAVNNPGRLSPGNADTGHALLVALHLKANNRRAVKAVPYEVWSVMDGAMGTIEGYQVGVSLNEAARIAAKQFGISESSAKRIYRVEKLKQDEYAEWVRTHPEEVM
jgi:hypothetical protein